MWEIYVRTNVTEKRKRANHEEFGEDETEREKRMTVTFEACHLQANFLTDSESINIAIVQ